MSLRNDPVEKQLPSATRFHPDGTITVGEDIYAGSFISIDSNGKASNAIKMRDDGEKPYRKSTPPSSELNTPSKTGTRSRDWIDKDGYFIFGKYKGDRIETIAKLNPGYLRWILDTVDNILPEDAKIIQTLLDRRG